MASFQGIIRIIHYSEKASVLDFKGAPATRFSYSNLDFLYFSDECQNVPLVSHQQTNAL